MRLSKKKLKEITRKSMIDIFYDESEENNHFEWLQEQIRMLLWHSIEEAYKLGRKSATIAKRNKQPERVDFTSVFAK